ncbi:hypothetical protein Tco_0409734 [Tanacetum coccineum]
MTLSCVASLGVKVLGLLGVVNGNGVREIGIMGMRWMMKGDDFALPQGVNPVVRLRDHTERLDDFGRNSSKVVALSLLFSWSLESSKSEFVRSSYGQNGGGVSGTTRLPIFFDLAYFLLRFFLFFRLVQYLES